MRTAYVIRTEAIPTDNNFKKYTSWEGKDVRGYTYTEHENEVPLIAAAHGYSKRSAALCGLARVRRQHERMQQMGSRWMFAEFVEEVEIG